MSCYTIHHEVEHKIYADNATEARVACGPGDCFSSCTFHILNNIKCTSKVVCIKCVDTVNKFVYFVDASDWFMRNRV